MRPTERRDRVPIKESAGITETIPAPTAAIRSPVCTTGREEVKKDSLVFIITSLINNPSINYLIFYQNYN
jgi:hypothetical protein